MGTIDRGVSRPSAYAPYGAPGHGERPPIDCEEPLSPEELAIQAAKRTEAAKKAFAYLRSEDPLTQKVERTEDQIGQLTRAVAMGFEVGRAYRLASALKAMSEVAKVQIPADYSAPMDVTHSDAVLSYLLEIGLASGRYVEVVKEALSATASEIETSTESILSVTARVGTAIKTLRPAFVSEELVASVFVAKMEKVLSLPPVQQMEMDGLLILAGVWDGEEELSQLPSARKKKWSKSLRKARNQVLPVLEMVLAYDPPKGGSTPA